MAGKNIQVNLQFNANVQNAKAQLTSLQNQLNTLVQNNASAGSLGITPQIQEATRSAMDLKIALNNATNVNTGKLNLNKFEAELKRSGKSIQEYAQHLRALGPEGVRAFNQMAQAVANADTKMLSLSGGMRKLANTFMNTVRWQLTSQAIMAVTGAISETVNYAKELDTSLNNIRIVTGKSADQMATFAKQANNAAKSLSTSTTKYTDASLIYYQQGLNDKAVKERTDVTVKLANVVGESAQTVSEWMTAIWNNFDDGSQSLEYYADVLAKLGAATASSADEIAGGLEKFAAVADTIGLSYEYAASALATITAETRQSEDVVGTALKTILSRMEQLKLGDVLEDGTTLGQYSLALKTVGVDIQEANGELKDMDVILQQTGARWETLARDEQIALAQSVAGIRQYTQFMALMDNWDVMEKNLDLTEQANGALQEQQRIYEESAKAAEERLKTAKEGIRASLFGGEDLKNMYDWGSGALEVLGDLVEAFGGLRGILLLASSALVTLYQPQISTFFNNLGVSIKNAGVALKNTAADLKFFVAHPIKTIKGEMPVRASGQEAFKNDVIGAATNINMQDENPATASIVSKDAEIQKTMMRDYANVNQNVKQRLDWEYEILRVEEEKVMKLQEQAKLSQDMADKKVLNMVNNPRTADLQKQAAVFGGAEGSLEMAEQLASQNIGVNLGKEAQMGLASAIRAEVVDARAAIMEFADTVPDELQPELNKINFDDFIQDLDSGEMKIEDMVKRLQELKGQLNTAADTIYSDTAEAGLIEADKAQFTKNNNMLASISHINEMQGTGGVTTEGDIGAVSQSMSNIDPNAITNQAALSGYEQAKTALAELTEMQAKGQQGTENYNKSLKKLNSGLNKFAKNSNGTVKSLTKQNKKIEENKKNTDKKVKAVKEDTKALQNNEKKQKTAKKSLDALDKSMDKFQKKLRKGPKAFSTFSDSLTAGIQVFASFASGLSMVESGVSSIASCFEDGEFSLSSFLSGLTSLSFGVLQVMSSVNNLNKSFGAMPGAVQTATDAVKANEAAVNAEKVATEEEILASEASVAASESEAIAENVETTATEGSTTAQTAENAVDAAEVAGTPAQVAASGAEAAGEVVEQTANVTTAVTGIAKQAGQGPVGWVTAAISAAMVAAMLGAGVVGAISASSANSKEAKQEEVSKGTETLEAINENQELASSVTDLTEEYNALRDAGKSTADVLEDMREKIPELIDSYKELAKTMGTHIDTSELEKAYEVFEKTGDTGLLEKAQKKIDDEIKEIEKSTALTTAETAKGLAIDAAREGDGRLKNDGTFVVRMGDADSKDNVDDLMEEELGKYWVDNNRIEIDTTNTGEVIDAYNKMIAARDRIKKEGKEDSDTYRELNREIKAMAESMPDLINAQEQLFDIEKEEALLEEKKFNSNLELQKVNSVEEYAAAKADLIKKLQEEKGWTEAQAEAYLKASEAYGGYAEAHEFFKEGGLGFNKEANEKTIKDIKEWFAKLPEEERTLAMTIDYTTVGSVKEAAAALEEAKKEAEKAKILQEVEALEVDAAVFETYTEGLISVNDELKENNNLTKQIALNNLKISKGLETLTKNWDKNLDIIQKGNKASLEYAEAIGEVKNAFEEMFGVKPSTEYVEQYFNEINEMANGNLDSLQKLQDALAEDYVMHMDFSTAINEDWSGTIKDAQTQLKGLLEDIDTSIEVGEGTTLSSDFLDSVQDMLDAGVITSEQLDQLFRAKGFELEVEAWDTIDGPIKTITRTTYPEGKPNEAVTEVIEEKEKIKVPIINGRKPKGELSGVASKADIKVATYTKSTDKRVIDTSALEDKANAAKDRREKLKDEFDRYHEINEIISDTERELDKLGKAKDKAFGANKIALMDKEIEKQKELIENNKKLLEEAEKYYQQDRNDLLSNYAVELDSTGRISNYEEIQQWYIDQLDKHADNETQYTKIEEQYEKFKDAASKYEESLNKVEEQAEKVNDEMDALYDFNMEKIEYTVQIKVDIADDHKAYLDFLMQKIEDDAFAAAEAIELLGEEASLTLDKIKANEEGIAEVERALAAGEITPEQATEKLREYRDELIDLNADLLEIRQTVQDKLTEAFEGWNEEIERGIAKLEHYGSVLDNYKNIIDIVGKDMLGLSDETMSKLSKTQVSNANDIIRATKAQLDANNTTLERMKQAREEARIRGDEESIKEWDEQIKVAEEKSQELTTTLQEALSNGLQLAADDFALTVDQIAESFSKAVSGIYDDIEGMREGWDRMQEVADRYLKTYEQTYEISKLNRKIQDNIDKTDNVASQKQLRDLQDEMYEMTKDGQQLSKYDLEYLQKKYDLMVAEQAFKDAQNAKSVVRLTRDSKGNFGYTYTADQSAIDNAEQNYEDKLYAYQDFTNKIDTEMTELFISTQEKMSEEINAAAEKYGKGTEAFLAEVEKIEARYKEDMEFITSTYDKMTDRNIEINSKFNASVAQTYRDTFLGKIQPDYDNFEELYSNTTSACETASNNLGIAITNLQNTFNSQFKLAGEDFNNFANKANKKFGEIQGDSSDTADGVETMAKDMDTALNGEGGAIDAVIGFQENYSTEMEKVREETQDTINKVNDLIKKYAELKNVVPSPEDSEDKSGKGIDTNPTGLPKNDGQGTTTPKDNDIDLSLQTGTSGYTSKYKITATGSDAQGYAIVQVNGNWYKSRSVNNGMGKVGDTATFIDEYAYKNSILDLSGQMIKTNEKAGGSSDFFSVGPKHGGKSNVSDPKREFKKYDNEWYVKALTSDKWYKVNDLTWNKVSKQGAAKYKIEKDKTPIYYSYDTGGYTGDWGPEGRLAMLHQKEIVLNAHDTENFLAAIGIVRDISDQIERNALSMTYQAGLNQMQALAANSGMNIKQEVYINAEFPSATDQNEIREALLSLSNEASQYITSSNNYKYGG